MAARSVGEGRRVLRLLVLANSYPTAATPSAAAYLTNRLAALERRDDVEVVAIALVPTYSRPAALARRARGLTSADALALAPAAGRLLRAAPIEWSLADVIAGRLGRRPRSAVRRATRAVRQSLGEWRPDAVLAHGMYTLPAGEVARRIAERAGAPFVVGLHGSDVTQVSARAPRSARATLEDAAATIYVSAALRDRAVQLGLPEWDTHVVPNGVDTALFGPASVSPASVEPGAGPGGDPWRADAAAPRLLFVGNLLPVKGADRLPAILAAVRRRAPGAHLDVVGDGSLRARLSADLGETATLHGRLSPSEVARHMRAADVLLVPSREEGWGCVATEALSCGTPVVASAVGGLPEAVGDPGRLVPEGPDYVESFASLTLRAVGAGVGAAPVARSWDEVVDAELAVVRAALRGPAGQADS